MRSAFKRRSAAQHIYSKINLLISLYILSLLSKFIADTKYFSAFR